MDAYNLSFGFSCADHFFSIAFFWEKELVQLIQPTASGMDKVGMVC